MSGEVPVVRGYFLLAGPLTPSGDPRYTITLIGEGGDVLAVETDISPPA